MADIELQSYYPDVTGIIQDTTHLFDAVAHFREIMMMYDCAAREIRTKFEVLNSDFSVRYNRNPIEVIKTRVKQPVSLFRKIKERGLPLDEDTLMHGIHDIAGVRVVCSFIDDIYRLARLIAGQDDITIVEIKDYIQHPKPNGYRSLHLIVQVPVFFADQTRDMTVEVQIRTMAMDFWASLDHELHYKKHADRNVNLEDVERKLAQSAEIIAETDRRMQEIRSEIYGENGSSSDLRKDLLKDLKDL